MPRSQEEQRTRSHIIRSHEAPQISHTLRSFAVGLALGESYDASRRSESTPNAERAHGKDGAAYTTRAVSKTLRTANSRSQGGCVYQGQLEEIGGSETRSGRDCWQHETRNVECGWNRLRLGMRSDLHFCQTNGKVRRKFEDYLDLRSIYV